MLAILVILGLIKLGYEQWKEDKIDNSIEEHEQHYSPRKDPLE